MKPYMQDRMREIGGCKRQEAAEPMDKKGTVLSLRFFHWTHELALTSSALLGGRGEYVFLQKEKSVSSTILVESLGSPD